MPFRARRSGTTSDQHNVAAIALFSLSSPSSSNIPSSLQNFYMMDRNRRNCAVPTLVSFAQRAAVKHLDFIESFGEDLGGRVDLLSPILAHGTAEQLFRLERQTPALAALTQAMWKALCQKEDVVDFLKIDSGEDLEPECWKNHYFVLKERARQKLENARVQLQARRQGLEKEKKDHQIKVSDRLMAIPDRKSGWGGFAPAPKTLMQQTRRKATAMQRATFNPPRHHIHNRVLAPSTVTAIFPAPPPNVHGQRPIVRASAARPQPHSSTSTSTSTSSSTSTSPPPDRVPAAPLAPVASNKRPIELSPAHIEKLMSGSAGQPVSESPRPPKRIKKDPMAALFLPKGRSRAGVQR